MKKAVRASNERDSKRERSLKEQTKKLAIIEGSAWSVMSGFGLQFITPYALALGATSFFIGMISAFSTLASAVGQYLGGWWMRRSKDRKSLIMTYTFLQAAMWIPIALLFLLGANDLAVAGLVVAYALLVLFGSISGPAWTSLISDNVYEKERGKYFGTRNQIVGFVELIAGLVAGAALGLFTGNIFLGFGVIFVIAAVARGISSYLFTKHYDPPLKLRKEKKVFEFPKDKLFWYFSFLVIGINFATNIAGPFFSVYMLRDLGFDYLTFAIANAATAVITLISMPYWGRLIDRYGTVPVLFSCAFLIPFIPILWLLSREVAWVIFVQLFSGFSWAGFNLAVFTFLIKISPRDQLHTYSANFNGIAAFTQFFGILMGSFLALFVNGNTIWLLTGLPIVFAISAVMRFLVLFISLRKLPDFQRAEKRKVDQVQFLWREVMLHPIRGIIGEMSHLHGIFITSLGLNGNGRKKGIFKIG